MTLKQVMLAQEFLRALRECLDKWVRFSGALKLYFVGDIAEALDLFQTMINNAASEFRIDKQDRRPVKPPKSTPGGPWVGRGGSTPRWSTSDFAKLAELYEKNLG